MARSGRRLARHEDLLGSTIARVGISGYTVASFQTTGFPTCNAGKVEGPRPNGDRLKPSKF